jgi:hypothetical protein
MDNVRTHNSGQAQKWIDASRAERLPHPFDSPDPTPSDFFLFEYIRGKLSNSNYESREDRLNSITESFTAIDQEVLPSVFESWVNRLKWVIKQKGKYQTT